MKWGGRHKGEVRSDRVYFVFEYKEGRGKGREKEGERIFFSFSSFHVNV